MKPDDAAGWGAPKFGVGTLLAGSAAAVSNLLEDPARGPKAFAKGGAIGPLKTFVTDVGAVVEPPKDNVGAANA